MTVKFPFLTLTAPPSIGALLLMNVVFISNMFPVLELIALPMSESPYLNTNPLNVMLFLFVKNVPLIVGTIIAEPVLIATRLRFFVMLKSLMFL